MEKYFSNILQSNGNALHVKIGVRASNTFELLRSKVRFPPSNFV